MLQDNNNTENLHKYVFAQRKYSLKKGGGCLSVDLNVWFSWWKGVGGCC